MSILNYSRAIPATEKAATLTGCYSYLLDGMNHSDTMPTTLFSEDDTKLSITQTPMPTTIDQYSLESELGSGGMATVYKAKDIQLERPVAIKVLHEHIARDEEHRERFIREARAVARLEHPNIIRIYGFADESSDKSYLAMELVDGPTLQSFIRSTPSEQRPPEIGAMIMCIAGMALEEAHQHGVLHRDIKPENLMIDASGSVKLMDFGLARLLDAHSVTTTGTLLGSPAHMAPEIIEGENYDKRVDVFSLGTVLYYACTGVLPFEGKNPAIILRKVLGSEFIPPSQHEPEILPGLEDLITRCLHLDPAERPPSARTFVNELRAILVEVGISNVKQEFASYWNDKRAWLKSWRVDLPGNLLACARQSAKRGPTGYPRAIAYCNRILAEDPENHEALELIETLGGTKQRSQPILRWVGILLLFLLCIGGAGVWYAGQQKNQRETAAGVTCLTLASASIVQAHRRAISGMTIQAASTKTIAAIDRALEDAGILRQARLLDARWAAATAINQSLKQASQSARAAVRRNTQRPDSAHDHHQESPPEELSNTHIEMPSFEVSFIISPPVADLMIDGERICSGTPRCQHLVSFGRHTVTARHPETRMETTRTIRITEAGAEYRLRVPWPPAGLYIESNIPSTVLFDGERIGRSGQLIRIPITSIGRVRRGHLRVIPDGSFNEPVERQIAIVAGETTRNSIRFEQ